MKLKILWMWMFLVCKVLVANENVVLLDKETINMNVRLLLNNPEDIFVCRLENQSQHDITIVESFFWSQFNEFILAPLNIESRRLLSLSPDIRIGSNTSPSTVSLLAGNAYEVIISRKNLFRRRDRFSGWYAEWLWSITPWPPRKSTGLLKSAAICIAFPDTDGKIAPAVVDPRNKTAKHILAFIFHENNEHELGFLMLNGTGEPVVLEKPLTQASRIVASAQAIEYKRDLFLSDQIPEETTIEPGKVGEWRLPWKTVHDLIPKEDLEKIKAAGGNLDLVWKAGEFESSPLPISLAAPKEE